MKDRRLVFVHKDLGTREGHKEDSYRRMSVEHVSEEYDQTMWTAPWAQVAYSTIPPDLAPLLHYGCAGCLRYY